jgi:hypothetical protein
MGRGHCNQRGKSPLPAATERQIVQMLANGLTQRQANAAIGYAAGAHWTAGNVVRRLKRRLAAGETPETLVAELGLAGPGDQQLLGFLRYLASGRVWNQRWTPPWLKELEATDRG